MIGNALDNSRLTDPAIAALAVMHRVFAGLEQHVEDGLAGRNLIDAPAALEFDLETRQSPDFSSGAVKISKCNRPCGQFSCLANAIAASIIGSGPQR